MQRNEELDVAAEGEIKVVHCNVIETSEGHNQGHDNFDRSYGTAFRLLLRFFRYLLTGIFIKFSKNFKCVYACFFPTNVLQGNFL